MTSEDRPWRSLDPEEADPEAIPQLDSGEAGRIVVVEVTESARKSGWAARAAVWLARSWGRSGERVVLADLGLDAPELHVQVGEENGEGIADVLLYGASIRRVARPQDGGGFYLASTGTPVADPEGVLTHSRWSGILDGFQGASVTLAAFLPEGAPGADAIRRRATHRVLLSPREEWKDRSADGGRTNDFLAVLGPPQEGVAPPAAGAAPTSPEGTKAGSEAGADPGGAGGASGAPTARAEPKATASPSSRRAKEKKGQRSASRWVVAILLIALAGGLLAIWFGYVTIPGLDLPR